IVCCCREAIAKEVGEILVRCAKEPAEFYGFRVPLDADYKIGRSWAGEPAPENASETTEEIPPDAVEPEKPDKARAEEAPQPEPPPRSSGNGHDYSTRKRRGGRLEISFFYCWPNGTPHQRADKMRLPDGKQYFNQFSWDAGQWLPKQPKVKIPYHAGALVAAPPNAPIRIMAGDKNVETMRRLGLIPATTNPGGEIKGAWTADLNHWFGGRQQVFIYEDNDATGRAHTIEVATALKGVVADIRVVRLPGLPEHGDVTDWIEKLKHKPEELLEQEKLAQPANTRSSAFRIHWFDDDDEPDQRWLIHDLMPETGCGLISGQWGTYKSSAALDL